MLSALVLKNSPRSSGGSRGRVGPGNSARHDEGVVRKPGRRHARSGDRYLLVRRRFVCLRRGRECRGERGATEHEKSALVLFV